MATNETLTIVKNEPSKISLQSGRHDSKVSINTSASARSHKDYLDSLIPPTGDEIRHIASIQEAKEEEIIRKRMSMENPDSEDDKAKAAALIQRNYRGYRERRQIYGMGLDPTSRWVEAIREARYRNLTTPKARGHLDGVAEGIGRGETHEHPEAGDHKLAAREKWRKIGLIARRAAADEDSDLESDENEDMPEDQREEKRRKRMEETQKRQRDAKVLDLQYFLEMVDLKHRYGTNLLAYHEQWKKSATNENFFYWLDEGEGRFIDMDACPRARLESERVRYLSKEERLNYLVKIDKDGRLVWAKNGVRIDTTEKYKDSIHGIVPATDSTPPYTEPDAEAATGLQRRSSGSEETSDSSTADHNSDSESARAAKYATPEFDKAHGMKKVKHVSAATIFNKLLRSSVQKNTWIFVADTSFRLYVGIKQSGAFQHSSFLHGSRIAAAGLIKIKDGLLDKLSPLSGHYRPNTSHFRAFLNSLRDAGADMSHVSISRSYAILLGLEAYVRTKRRSKKIVSALIHGRDNILTYDQLKQREEESLNKTETAERERRLTDIQRDEDAREDNKATIKLLRKLHIRPVTPKHAVNGDVNRHHDEDDLATSRTSLENEISAEEMKRV